MTDGLLRRVEVRRDLTGGQLAAAHQPKDLTAVGVGERPKYGIGGVTLIDGASDASPSCAHHQGSQPAVADSRRFARASRRARSASDWFGFPTPVST